MAIVQMERINLCAMKRDRKQVLELLQRRGVVEIHDAGAADDVFQKADTTEAQNLFAKNAETAEKALEILAQYGIGKGGMLDFLKGRTAVTPAESQAFYQKQDEVAKAAADIVAQQKQIGEAKAEIIRADGQLAALVPWMKLPVPQAFTGTKKTAAFIGSLESEYNEGSLLAALAAQQHDLDAVHVEIVYASKEQTNFLMLVPKAEADKAENALRALGFARPAAPSRLMPAEQKQRIEERKAEAQKSVIAAEKAIKGYAKMHENICFLADHMKMRAEKYEVIEKLAQTRHVFVLQGFVPAKAGPALQQELEAGYDCAVELAAPAEADDVPVLLHNNKFAEPTEGVLESYSLPGKGELDPTPVMAIFYYIMFGMMFSDAGYGLIMAGVCGVLLLAFKNMERNWKKNLRMFFWCGVSTIFWGVMYSSYFGNVVNVVSETFFGKEVAIPPLWFSPLENPMQLLMFCLGIGVVHLSVGVILQGVTLFKNKDYIGILYDVVFSLVCIYPLIILLMGSSIFENMAGFSLALPAVLTPVLLGIAGVGMVGVLLTGGRESKNWFKRILKGAYALYNVLAGWLGDVLSYSRLLALGLATGVIAEVINTMGVMPAGGNLIIGAVVFAVIFVIGHLLNFGINVLGAYVHSNRLEFVEFFGKFYEGGGRKFAPFGIHTKHYKIEEEAKQ